MGVQSMVRIVNNARIKYLLSRMQSSNTKLIIDATMDVNIAYPPLAKLGYFATGVVADVFIESFDLAVLRQDVTWWLKASTTSWPNCMHAINIQAVCLPKGRQWVYYCFHPSDNDVHVPRTKTPSANHGLDVLNGTLTQGFMVISDEHEFTWKPYHRTNTPFCSRQDQPPSFRTLPRLSVRTGNFAPLC